MEFMILVVGGTILLLNWLFNSSRTSANKRRWSSVDRFTDSVTDKELEDDIRYKVSKEENREEIIELLSESFYRSFPELKDEKKLFGYDKFFFFPNSDFETKNCVLRILMARHGKLLRSDAISHNGFLNQYTNQFALPTYYFVVWMQRELKRNGFDEDIVFLEEPRYSLHSKKDGSVYYYYTLEDVRKYITDDRIRGGYTCVSLHTTSYAFRKWEEK